MPAAQEEIASSHIPVFGSPGRFPPPSSSPPVAPQTLHQSAQGGGGGGGGRVGWGGVIFLALLAIGALAVGVVLRGFPIPVEGGSVIIAGVVVWAR